MNSVGAGTDCLILLLAVPVMAQTHGSQVMQVDETDLRAHASVYPTPAYPPDSVRANHAGRVVIELVVTQTKTSPLARVAWTKVLAAPDASMADAVLASLKDARYVPFFDDRGQEEVSIRVAWDFRITDGVATVLDPNAPPRRSSDPAVDDLRMPQSARELLSSEAAWNRNDNRQCPPNAKAVSLYCYCALERATPRSRDDPSITGGWLLEDARSRDRCGHAWPSRLPALADGLQQRPLQELRRYSAGSSPD